MTAAYAQTIGIKAAEQDGGIGGEIGVNPATEETIVPSPQRKPKGPESKP